MRIKSLRSESHGVTIGICSAPCVGTAPTSRLGSVSARAPRFSESRYKIVQGHCATHEESNGLRSWVASEVTMGCLTFSSMGAIPSLARQKGIAVPGHRQLLPPEVSKKIGPLDANFETGYDIAGHGPKERILRFVAGRSVTDQVELDVDLYDVRTYDTSSHSTTLDLGGRYKLFLSNYGRTFTSET
jgi:hypothetical protein